MNAVDMGHLRGLYATTDDPWNFRTSAYEQDKFAATLAARRRDRYAGILEIGCGNGELARRLGTMCDHYAGLDAVERAVEEARKALPRGAFTCAYFPCPLPEGRFDLIVVSEFLYFLDVSGIDALARQIALRWPQAEVLSVNYLGPTGNALQGAFAADRFASALAATHTLELQDRRPRFRIDRMVPSARKGACP